MKRSYSGYLYIVLCAVIFSTMEVMLKTVHGVFAPMQITCLRFLIGGLLLIPFALRSMKKKGAAFTRADAGFFALTGFLCVAFSMVLYQMAVTYTKASVVAIIFSCNPIFVTVLAYFLLREEIHRNHIIALALELLAVFIIIDPLHASLDPTGALLAIASALVFSFYSVVGKKRTPRFGGIAVTCFSFLFGSVELLAVFIIIDPLHASLDPTGALLAIASALVFSFYSVVSKKRTPRFGGIAVTCFSFLFGSTELLVILLLGRTAAVGGLFASLGLDIFVNVSLFSGIPLSALPALAYICAVNSAAGYVCHMMALEKTSAQEASLIFFLKPMIAPLFAFLFLREEITANMLLGIVCFLVGSGIAILPGLLAQKKQRA